MIVACSIRGLTPGVPAVFDQVQSCATRLLAPHFAITGAVAESSMSLFQHAFNSAVAGSASTAQTSCSNDTYSFYGRVAVPAPGLTATVPFAATLPAIAGPNGALADGLVLSVGPVALESALGINASSGSLLAELTTVAIGARRALATRGRAREDRALPL